VGREKCEKYPKKNKRNLLLFGGEIQNLGGEISPPKGPEKSTVCKVYVKCPNRVHDRKLQQQS